MLKLVMLRSFLIHDLSWCIKSSFTFTYVYPCINNSCIANNMICDILNMHPINNEYDVWLIYVY